jgi:hypothetical protein
MPDLPFQLVDPGVDGVLHPAQLLGDQPCLRIIHSYLPCPTPIIIPVSGFCQYPP